MEHHYFPKCKNKANKIKTEPRTIPAIYKSFPCLIQRPAFILFKSMPPHTMAAIANPKKTNINEDKIIATIFFKSKITNKININFPWIYLRYIRFRCLN